MLEMKLILIAANKLQRGPTSSGALDQCHDNIIMIVRNQSF